jgi:hypothetical protein
MFFYKLLNFFTMTEFWDKPAEKSGKVLAAFLEGQPLAAYFSWVLPGFSALSTQTQFLQSQIRSTYSAVAENS